jgi:hypothetical protein
MLKKVKTCEKLITAGTHWPGAKILREKLRGVLWHRLEFPLFYIRIFIFMCSL